MIALGHLEKKLTWNIFWLNEKKNGWLKNFDEVNETLKLFEVKTEQFLELQNKESLSEFDTNHRMPKRKIMFNVHLKIIRQKQCKKIKGQTG